MTEAQAVAEMVEMAGELGALKEVVKKAHPDWSGLPKGTSIIATARELLDSLTADLAAARQEFAEWLDASRKALDAHAEVVAERDRLAAMVERQKPVLDAAHDVVGWQGTQREEQAWATLRDSLSAMEGSDV